MTAADERGTSASDLEGWVREELKLAPETAVTVTERPGTDPRCSPLVTQLSITDPGGAPYDFHIERPLGDVTQMDVVAAIAFGGGH